MLKIDKLDILFIFIKQLIQDSMFLMDVGNLQEFLTRLQQRRLQQLNEVNKNLEIVNNLTTRTTPLPTPKPLPPPSPYLLINVKNKREERLRKRNYQKGTGPDVKEQGTQTRDQNERLQ